jgi:hypothetical protein
MGRSNAHVGRVAESPGQRNVTVFQPLRRKRGALLLEAAVGTLQRPGRL